MAKETVHTLKSISLRHAFASPYGLVCSIKGIHKQSEYPMFPDWKNILTFFKKISLGRVQTAVEPCLITINPFWDNYYHWLAECMPRLFANVDQHNELAIILPKRAPKFVKEYVKLFNFQKIIWIEENALIYSHRMFFANSLPYNRFDEKLMMEMTTHILQKLEIEPQPIYKIFISRAKAKYRRSDQEESLFKIYEKEGFQKYRLEELDVVQQIKLFAHAKEIVGIHGAGFTNLLYAHHCERIVDYIHREHNDLVFQTLATLLGIDFQFVYCQGAGVNSFKNNDDLVIDLDA